jgi:hypothetical protein
MFLVDILNFTRKMLAGLIAGEILGMCVKAMSMVLTFILRIF